MTDLSELDRLLAEQPLAPPTLAGASGRRPPKPIPDPARVLRNRRNRNRGKSTSRDLADYLGWQNVEGMLWPWDVQGPAGRIQSKRDLSDRGPLAALRVIGYIPESPGYLRGLFHVPPRSRLTSGTVTLLLEEWVGWHGWDMPDFGTLAVANRKVPLLTMPLPVFRDVHCASAAP